MPDTVLPDIPPEGYTRTPMFKTLMVGPTDGNITQRRRKFLSVLYKFNIKWGILLKSEEKTLCDFFLAKYGMWGEFAMFDFVMRDFVALSIGTGDGTTDTFNLKAKSTSNLVVKVDGVTKTLTTHYTIGAGAGTDGQDRIVFTGGNIPTAGQAITADYSGRYYYPKCIFEADVIDIDAITGLLYRAGIVIREIK